MYSMVMRGATIDIWVYRGDPGCTLITVFMFSRLHCSQATYIQGITDASSVDSL